MLTRFTTDLGGAVVVIGVIALRAVDMVMTVAMTMFVARTMTRGMAVVMVIMAMIMGTEGAVGMAMRCFFGSWLGLRDWAHPIRAVHFF